MISIVRQRQLIEGQRTSGIVMAVIGLLGVGFGILTILDGASLWGAVVSATLLVTGVMRIRAAVRTLAAFEAEHGVGAGVQQPIR